MGAFSVTLLAARTAAICATACAASGFLSAGARATLRALPCAASPCVGAITRGGAGDAATGVFWCCSIGSTASITASITTFVAAAIGTAVTASRLLAAVSTLSLTAPMRRLTAGT